MLSISNFESEFLDIRIARCDLDELNDEIVEQIRASAIEQNIDVIRLKLDAAIHSTHLLEKLAFPFSFSGGISEYIFKGDNLQHSTSKQKLEFIEITKNEIELFKDFFYQTFNEHDIGYHNAPFLTDLISKKNELDCLYLYYADFIHKENHKLIFLKKDGNLIGFSTIQITNDGILLLPITGILPKYRSKGLYYELCESYTRYIIDNNLVCIFSSRNENNLARQVYSSFAFKHYGCKYNYNITPLLSKNSLSEKIQIIDYSFTDVETCILEIKNKLQFVNDRNIKLRNCQNYFNRNFEKNSSCTIETSQPFSNDLTTLYVCKLMQNDTVQSIFWLEYEYC